MMEHQQTAGISAPLRKHTHQVKGNQHRDEKMRKNLCVCVRAQCEVCACDLVSYVIIQAYVYLADEIILLSIHKR